MTHDTGYHVGSVTALAENGKIRLKPWCKVHGTLKRDGNAAEAGQTVALHGPLWFTPDSYISYNDRTETREAGQFIFERVPAGTFQFGRRLDGAPTALTTHHVFIEVKPDRQNEVVIGNSGVSIAGQLVLPEDTSGTFERASLLRREEKREGFQAVEYFLTSKQAVDFEVRRFHPVFMDVSCNWSQATPS